MTAKRKFTNIVKAIQREFLRTTDTLWDNEIKANIFVSHVLFVTGIVALFFLLLNSIGVFSINQTRMVTAMDICAILAFGGAQLSHHFKGEKKWLKTVLLVLYIIIFEVAECILGHNIHLVMLFPVVLSVRYYSQPLTIVVSILTLIAALFADYFCVYQGVGVIDLNFVNLLPATIVEGGGALRNYIDPSMIDRNATWGFFLVRSFLPRYVMTSMVSIICGKIAQMGRKAIFDQQAETAKSERISTELDLASSIQANMLPNIFPAFPDRDDFDIYASMTPAKEVGGDFYDFFMVDEDHLAMVIADVSGKGIPAAMFMVIAKTLIKDHAQLGLTPSMVFTKVNDTLCEGNEAGLFVTAWMAMVELSTGKMVYANAGHNPPVIMKNGKIDYLRCPPGFVLAGMEGYDYREFELDLNKGDKLFLYTDGVTEAANGEHKLYGEERLINTLKSLEIQGGCADVIRQVRQDIDLFVGDEEQSDDLTMLAFDYTAKVKNRGLIERTFDASVDNLREVLAFVEEGLEKHDADMKATMAVTVSLEEIFVNIANYAYPGRKGKARVGMYFDEDRIYVYTVDSGIPFNPLENEDPDITLAPEDRDIGGLGILMVKKSMDECSYERKGNENRFIMSKKIK